MRCPFYFCSLPRRGNLDSACSGLHSASAEFTSWAVLGHEKLLFAFCSLEHSCECGVRSHD